MPYARSLQAYCLPEFDAEAPDSWQRRLREISPVTENMAHLRFRKFEPRPWWRDSEFNLEPERPIWVVYSCTPRRMIRADRAEQFVLHWSELDQTRQAGRKAVVSDYQHYMWHVHGVEVRPLYVLQCEASGGTPTLYTSREKRYLDAVGANSEPFPLGMFAGIPFTERVVKNLLARDRLLQACNRYDDLEKMDRTEAKKAEDEAAELLFRETYLDTISELVAPAVEFMKSQKGRAEVADAVAAGVMPAAPEGLEYTLATWKDVWKETGRLPGVGAAPHQKVFAVS